MLVDCHAHLTAEAFAADLDTVLGRAQAAGVAAVLVVGEDLADDGAVAALTGQPRAGAPALLPCFGYHPDRFADERPLPEPAAVDAVLRLMGAEAGRLAAIGEVGLDGWVTKADDRRRAQEALLERIVAVAV